MATKMQKITNYFSHDSNARNDEKLVRLRMKHGAAGYGVYFMILERMREEADYMSAKDYNMIAFDLRVSAAIVKSVVEDFGLFVFTDGGEYFYSESFNRRMNNVDALRRQRSKAGKKGSRARWGPTTQSTITGTADAEHDTDMQNQWLIELFDAQIALQNFCAAEHMTPEQFRDYAAATLSEWELASETHSNATEFKRHLLATIRIKHQRHGTKKDTVDTDDPRRAERERLTRSYAEAFAALAKKNHFGT